MRYVVVGNRVVAGHAPGETFEDDMDPVMEARLTAGGHIARVSQIAEVQKNDSIEPTIAHEA